MSCRCYCVCDGACEFRSCFGHRAGVEAGNVCRQPGNDHWVKLVAPHVDVPGVRHYLDEVSHSSHPVFPVLSPAEPRRPKGAACSRNSSKLRVAQRYPDDPTGTTSRERAALTRGCTGPSIPLYQRTSLSVGLFPLLHVRRGRGSSIDGSRRCADCGIWALASKMVGMGAYVNLLIGDRGMRR